MEFIVEPSGRADMRTFRALESDHPLFTRAVQDALPRMRFSAAVIGGRTVPQRLVMPFKFARKK